MGRNLKNLNKLRQIGPGVMTKRKLTCKSLQLNYLAKYQQANAKKKSMHLQGELSKSKSIQGLIHQKTSKV